MKLSETYSMKLKRRREGKTDYKKRLYLLRSKKPRLVIRSKSNQIIVQVVDYMAKGDIVKVGATSVELRKYGWKNHTGNSSSAYMIGFVCGKKALDKGIKECILDIGLHTPVHGSTVFAALKGAVDSGLKVPHDESCFPDESRLDMKSIEETKKAVIGWKKKKKK
ncbi:MAG: 50S ribosomal protein L18 [Candidatus Diapherotrites archaeon]|nr:50S ribosomal protein L18 [Candidatus Diapherotrites archaeon]